MSNEEKIRHPDSIVRLASFVYRFRLPQMTRKVSFSKSFKTIGTHKKTQLVLLGAEMARQKLDEALKSKEISNETVTAEASRYLPLIRSILVSCTAQPEIARLDERLLFEWMSGVEKEPKPFTCQALVYEMVMTIVCEGLGKAATGSEVALNREYAAASREFAAAAGIFAFLSEDYLMRWSDWGGNENDGTLPAECSIGVTQSLKQLYMANGQQMAIATLLSKPGVPNYSLVAKLCLGVSKQLEIFSLNMRKDASEQAGRMDKDFFLFINFQVKLQASLALYFQARNLFGEHSEYGDAGLAIAVMREAISGVQQVTDTVAYKQANDDLKHLTKHMQLLLSEWEKENSSMYYETIPKNVPDENKLRDKVDMKKVESYTLQDAEPVLFTVPDKKPMFGFFGKPKKATYGRTDSDLARELQAKLNAGYDG